MPVTAKLSKAFYDQLGEQIANELVEWFNQVDATYRNDLRELNEANFQRFSAHLEERVAMLEAKLSMQIGAVESKVEQQTTALKAELEPRIVGLENKLEQRMARLEATLERRLGEQTRWLFLTWALLLIPIIGLWFRG